MTSFRRPWIDVILVDEMMSFGRNGGPLGWRNGAIWVDEISGLSQVHLGTDSLGPDDQMSTEQADRKSVRYRLNLKVEGQIFATRCFFPYNPDPGNT